MAPEGGAVSYEGGTPVPSERLMPDTGVPRSQKIAPPLEAPQGPRQRPTQKSQWGALVYVRGTPVPAGEATGVLH